MASGRFGYFVLLTSLLAFAYGVTLLPVLWAVHTEAPGWVDAALDHYPDHLRIDVVNGRASTNVPEPYFIPLSNGEDHHNLLVIDTRTPFSATQFNRYDTFAWLTADVLHVRGDNQIRTVDLSQLQEDFTEDFTVDKSLVEALGDYVRPWLALIGPTLIFGAVVGLVALYWLRLLYLLPAALLIWLVARLFRRPGGYAVAYKTGLYAMTLAFLVEMVVSVTAPWTGFGGFPFMFTAITVGVVAANYLGLRDRPSYQPTPLSPS